VKFALVAGIVLVALVGSRLMRLRKPQAPTQPKMAVPTQVDRQDFPNVESPWLVVIFSSATCHTCADVVAKAAVLATSTVAVANIEYPERKDLHERYGVDAVPLVVVVDALGVVKGSFIGPVTATDLWAGVAECRQPGSRPTSACEGSTDE
jgi:hypothetical protein